MDTKERDLTGFITRMLEDVVKEKELDVRVTPETDMFATDILDSLHFLKLITMLEDEFGLDIDFSEYEPDEFKTIQGFIACLTR